jgi:hypothetical protein
MVPGSPRRSWLTDVQAKHNRVDQSYATSDLFVPNPRIPNAWKYHSRADAQLTLLTGKKFDPAPIEAAITSAAAPLLADALVFGNDKPYPGVLLFPSRAARGVVDGDVLSRVWAVVEKLNAEGQDHTQISRGMLVFMPFEEDALEKSSKGTVLRGRAGERYREAIDVAYSHVDDGDEDFVPDEDLGGYLVSEIESRVDGRKTLAQDTDLFGYGLDSVASMQLRGRVKRLLPNDAGELPLSIVEDCGTVRELTKYIIKRRHKLNGSDNGCEQSGRNKIFSTKLMMDLVDKWSDFPTSDAHAGQDAFSATTTVSCNDTTSAAGPGEVVVSISISWARQGQY